MEIIYNNHFYDGGIYKIYNKLNGRIYIGSTCEFRTRFRTHMKCLLHNKHPNNFLQHDFNKCGSNNFIIEIIEVINDDKEKRLEREQFYISQYYDNQINCYNFRLNASETRKNKKNKNPSDPNFDKRCKSPSMETTMKRVESLKNTYKNNKQVLDNRRRITKEVRWKNHSVNITLVNMNTKEEVFIKGSLRHFAEERNISYRCLHLLKKGKIKSCCGGWYLKEKGEPVYISQKGQKRKPLSKEHREKLSKGKYEGVKLINKDGNILIIGKNTKEFVRENKMRYGTLVKVINKQCKSIKGYKLME